MGAVGIYQWLDNVLRTEYEEVRLLKQSGRGSVRLIRHRATGRRFILRRYSGEAEVYRKLLDYSCPNLPETLEVAVQRRLMDELGVSCPCREVGSFVYRHQFAPDLYEYEYDHVFVGAYAGPVTPNPEEIMETRWYTKEEILSLLIQDPARFAPWFITAFPMAIKDME